MKHTLDHALNPAASGCACSMRAITHCVICQRQLAKDRDQVDTCGGNCYRKLRALQRTEPS